LSLVCPLDFRYGRKEMKEIFSEDARLRYVLRVEAALARAQAKVGNIPAAHAAEITRKATPEFVKMKRVKAIEKEIRHDLMAIVKALAEQCKTGGGSVHRGATSYDMIDTGIALQIGDGLDLIEDRLRFLLAALLKLAKEHKNTVMLGRTHGQAAIPMTFGFKMIVFAAEVARHLERAEEVRERAVVGKMSGAVGTGAGFGKSAAQIQSLVMADLRIGMEPAATQIVQRDRYVDLIGFCANVATSMEKFATEVRNLQRTELWEAAEYYDVKKQVGSSTMAQKQNPTISEQVSGLARLVRANIIPTMENAIQWHERDLANSSSERFLLPHTMILTDWIIHQMASVFERLRVFPERMLENLDRTGGLVMAEPLLLALTEKGMSRQDAHEHVRKIAVYAHETKRSLAEVGVEDPLIQKYLRPAEFRKVVDPSGYVGQAPRIVAELVKQLTPKTRTPSTLRQRRRRA
jgi:adenylosuccinate lyase